MDERPNEAMDSEVSDSDSEREYVSSLSSGDENVDEEPDEWQPTLGGPNVHTRVVQLTSMRCCAKKCLSGHEAQVEKFVFSLEQMSKDGQRTSLLTAVTVSASIVATKQQRGRDERQRYVYFLPFCGEVCKVAFQMCYQVSNDTLNRVRGQVRAGKAYILPHKNARNEHARKTDADAISNWLRRFAERIGDQTAIRFRHQTRQDGVIVRYVTKQQVWFLPPYFTWATLLQEYENYLAMLNPGTELPTPSLRSFQRVASECCQDIVIRAPSSNVCDVCVLYRIRMRDSSTVTDAENAAAHTLDARAMREQYAKDTGSCSPVHYVTTIDFSQNVALPHVSSTPSAWYFLSLMSVSLFGVFSSNSNDQTNYIYSELAAGKGSNEVVSMLHNYATNAKLHERAAGEKKAWTICADNCGGQNKNNTVIRFLLFLVNTGMLKAANLNFFIKGHTKNNCDRGFGTIKRSYVRQDLYTVTQVEAMVEASSTTNKCVSLESSPDVFREWKGKLGDTYRELPGIQKYQLFSMDELSPGIVHCRKRPSSVPVSVNLRRSDHQPCDPVTFFSAPSILQKPIPNPEKVSDLHKKILPYIPTEFKNDPLYRTPTEEQREEAAAKKKRRLKVTATLVSRRRNDGEQKSQNT